MMFGRKDWKTSSKTVTARANKRFRNSCRRRSSARSIPADDAACARLFAPYAQTNWRQLRAEGLAPQVLVMNGRLRGYAAALPVPGLPGLGDLIGVIDPAHRRQGLGTLLLDHLCVWLPAAGIRELAVPVTDLQHPLPAFCSAANFIPTMKKSPCAATSLWVTPPFLWITPPHRG
jgi:GNAT superfamily N-acetyltransferase